MKEYDLCHAKELTTNLQLSIEKAESIRDIRAKGGHPYDNPYVIQAMPVVEQVHAGLKEALASNEYPAPVKDQIAINLELVVTLRNLVSDLFHST